LSAICLPVSSYTDLKINIHNRNLSLFQPTKFFLIGWWCLILPVDFASYFAAEVSRFCHFLSNFASKFQILSDIGCVGLWSGSELENAATPTETKFRRSIMKKWYGVEEKQISKGKVGFFLNNFLFYFVNHFLN
jgi:hypothetical protein